MLLANGNHHGSFYSLTPDKCPAIEIAFFILNYPEEERWKTNRIQIR